MGQPFVLVRIDVEFGAERVAVELTLGAGIDERALLVVEGPSLKIAFDQIGPRIGPQVLHHPADMREQRIVPPQRMPPLEEVVDCQQQQRDGEDEAPAQPFDHGEQCGEQHHDQRGPEPHEQLRGFAHMREVAHQARCSAKNSAVRLSASCAASSLRRLPNSVAKP